MIWLRSWTHQRQSRSHRSKRHSEGLRQGCQLGAGIVLFSRNERGVNQADYDADRPSRSIQACQGFVGCRSCWCRKECARSFNRPSKMSCVRIGTCVMAVGVVDFMTIKCLAHCPSRILFTFPFLGCRNRDRQVKPIQFDVGIQYASITTETERRLQRIETQVQLVDMDVARDPFRLTRICCRYNFTGWNFCNGEKESK